MNTNEPQRTRSTELYSAVSPNWIRQTVENGCGPQITNLRYSRLQICATALFIWLLLGSSAFAAAPDMLTVAVFDFESKDEAVRDLGPKVGTLVNASLSTEPQLITV